MTPFGEVGQLQNSCSEVGLMTSIVTFCGGSSGTVDV